MVTYGIGKARNLLRVSSRAVDGGMPLRIALLTWESLHTIAVGGVAPHVTELAAGLERRGHEVRLPLELEKPTKAHNVTELAAGLERQSLSRLSRP